MKKLLIVTQHFPPEIGAASNRIKQMISQFQKQDMDIYVITTNPNYPNPKLYTKEMIEKESQNIDFHLYRSPILSGPFPDKILRLMNQILFIFFALVLSTFLTLRYSIKTCITTSPPFLVNFVGLYCKVILRRKWVMEVRDLWPDSLIAVGAVKESNILYRILKKLELSFYKVSNRIVLVTNRTKDILVKQGIDKNKIYIITNGIPNWILQGEQRTRSASDILNVSYIGNIGLSQNLDILLDVAEKLKSNEKIHFNIIGEGLAKNALVTRAQKQSVKNITFIDGTTDKNKLIQYYQQADIGIVSLNSASLFENVIPSKIFEYAACETDILFLGSGEAAELIEQYSLGISIEPNAEKVAEVIKGFAEGSLILNLESKKRREFIEKYSWKHLIKKYIKVLSIDK